MVSVEIILNDNTKYIEKVESFSALEFEKKLNNHEYYMIAIGGTVFNKTLIRTIRAIGNN
ncbi:hypothetical protein NST17_19850 [Caldifermentibacillus hisashii]|uniref:Uncharacterized protein n=1 Tax=Caldifermentibacillus hisashii TaxID=996558 RepID=A0ABU9K2S7_9BACI